MRLLHVFMLTCLSLCLAQCEPASTSSLQQVIGHDDRKEMLSTGQPSSMLLYLTRPNGVICTASLVSPRFAVTAAHCVLEAQHVAADVTLVRNHVDDVTRHVKGLPTRDIAAAFHKAQVVSHGDFDAARENFDQDWAILEITPQAPVDAVPNFPIILSPTLRATDKVLTAGYSLDFLDKRGTASYDDTCKISATSGGQLFHTCDTAEGASGSPVWVIDKERSQLGLLGIHSGAKGTENIAVAAQQFSDRLQLLGIPVARHFEDVVPSATAAPLFVPESYPNKPWTVGAEPGPVADLFASPLTQTICARLNSGSVKCWGDDSHDQLGFHDSGVIDSPQKSSPIALANIKHVALGVDHACLDDGQDAYCYGNNGWGQRGDGLQDDFHFDRTGVFPPAIKRLDTVTQVAAGQMFTCAVLGKRKLVCWGYFKDGQLGKAIASNATVYAQDSAFVHEFPDDIIDLRLGFNHGCLLLASGQVSCWGSNLYGQTGRLSGTDPKLLNQTAADFVVLPARAKQIAVGYFHSCALLTNDKMQCWGNGQAGQLGDGLMTNEERPSTAFDLDGPIRGITAGGWHTCAFNDKNVVSCWGSNKTGELGFAPSANVTRSNEKSFSLKNAVIKNLVAGFNFTCALLQSGQATCWGDNSQGQLGLGHRTPVARSDTRRIDF